MNSSESTHWGDASAVTAGIDAMAKWRERFLLTILRYLFGVGVVVAVPSVYAAARDGLWSLVIVDSLALVVAFVLWRMTAWAYKVRVWSLMALVSLLGAFLLVVVGAVGQFYLMSIPVLVAVLLNRRAAGLAVVLDGLAVFGLGYFSGANVHIPGFDGSPLLMWAVITLNFTFASSVMTVMVATLLQKLADSLAQQHRAYDDLMHETLIRKRTEDKLRQLNASLAARVRERTLQLESMNRELEAFSYTVSHDLRAPLRSINGFSALLEQALPKPLPPDALHAIERIRANTVRMGDLIDALLDLSQLSHSPVTWEEVDLAVMAREAVAHCLESEPHRRVRLRVPESLVVQGDAHLLRAVMANLVGNAFKFSARQAEAIVEVGTGTTEDGEKFIFVRDNGVGFDMAYAHKLFGAFERLHDEKEFPGIGIGLLTVQRVIALHGGRVWAQGEIDKGATLFFSLGGPATGPASVPG